MITVSDIVALPAFHRIELVAPGRDAMARPVRNIGIMDAAPGEDAYSEYLPGEFIVTNLGFARDDPALAELSLQAMLARDLSALAVRNVYGLPVPQAAFRASSESGTPLFVYEGAYYEQVVFQALNLIHRDREESDKGRRVDELLAARVPADIRAALYNIARATGATLQCVAVRPSGGDECSLYATLDALSAAVASFKRAWGTVETACALRRHDSLLAFASYDRPPLEGPARSETALVSSIEAIGPVHAGVSEEVPLSEGDLAVRQALAALDCARMREDPSVVRWGDMGEQAFRVAAGGDRLFSRTCALYRRRIEEHDRENDAELLATAEAFARAGGDVRAASEELFQHPNTVRYRLRKLKGVLDMDDATDRELARFLGFVFLAS